MNFVEGFNHVAVITPDLDRKARFYADMFGLQLVNVGQTPIEPHLRSGHLTVGPHEMLHLVEDPTSGPMFPGRIGRRGPLDHFGLRVDSRQALEEVRGRLVDRGASDGTITDFGEVLSVFFRDCDGMECEVGWAKASATATTKNGAAPSQSGEHASDASLGTVNQRTGNRLARRRDPQNDTSDVDIEVLDPRSAESDNPSRSDAPDAPATPAHHPTATRPASPTQRTITRRLRIAGLVLIAAVIGSATTHYLDPQTRTYTPPWIDACQNAIDATAVEKERTADRSALATSFARVSGPPRT